MSSSTTLLTAFSCSCTSCDDHLKNSTTTITGIAVSPSLPLPSTKNTNFLRRSGGKTGTGYDAVQKGGRMDQRARKGINGSVSFIRDIATFASALYARWNRLRRLWYVR